MRTIQLIHGASSIASGALGGVIGTAIMRGEMKLANKLPEPLQMPTTHGSPGEYVITRAAEVAGRTLAPEARARWANALSWAYGTGWATMLGLVAAFEPLRTWKRAVGAGAAFGAIVWGAGYLGWLPLAGLTEPVHRERPTKTLSSLVGHVVYGIAAALPIYAVFKLLPRALPPRLKYAMLATQLYKRLT